MKDFMYIFRGSRQNEEAFMGQTPQQMEAEMQKWNVWMESLARQGKLVGGQPLFPSGKVVKGVSNKILDGPFTEGKDIVGGYLLIKANDMDDALALSKGCPTLEGTDGTVEIREIMPIDQS